MKKLIALGIATGLAVAAFLGTTMLSTSGAVESTAEPTSETRIEPVARNLVDLNNGFYAGEMPNVDARVIDEHTAPNLVDFQNGFYAGEMLKVEDIARPTASTARNAVDWNNGLYAGELP